MFTAGAKAAPLEALPIYFGVRLGRYLSGAGHFPEPDLVAGYLTVIEALADLAAGHATPSGVGLFPESPSVPFLIHLLYIELAFSCASPVQHCKMNMLQHRIVTVHTIALSFPWLPVLLCTCILVTKGLTSS